MARRTRVSEFAWGGFIAALPGSVQSVFDFMANTRVLPTAGHWVEIALAIVFGTLAIQSIFRFGEATSRDLLEELFPEAMKNSGFAWRLGMIYRRIKKNFDNN